MTDFLIQFGPPHDADDAVRVLRERPHLDARPVHPFDFPWGRAWVMPPPGAGYRPAQIGGRLVAAAGRPRLSGVEHEAGGETGFATAWDDLAGRGSVGDAAAQLTGMGVVLLADDTGVRIITDRLGSRPAYIARDHQGGIRAAGTHLESIAAAAGRSCDFDRVSVGELIVHNYITFPHTSRLGVTECDPGSVTSIGAGGDRVKAEAYWTPDEPGVWPGERAIFDELVGALRAAGEDVTLGCGHVAVTLSGGKDSRLVMGVVPRERLAAGLTYCTRSNRETDVARRVAEAFGVPQVLVKRDPDFYAGLLDRGSSLLGIELRANAHGLCIADNGLADDFDLILGGQLSDTLLKDHFMPVTQREALRRKPPSERAKSLVKKMLGRAAPPAVSTQSTLGRAQVEWVLNKDILDAVRERRRRRLEEVRAVRPETAEEWFRFWPASRQDDSSHTLGNSRLYPADTLFLHTGIIQVARRLAPRLRVGGGLADRAFAHFYGPSARVENANTGLPLDAPARRVRAHEKRLWRNPDEKTAFKRLPPSDTPWNDVQGSWVDSRMLQMQSPTWARYREELLGCPPAVTLIDSVLSIAGRDVIAGYDDRLPATANHLVMQIARVVRSLGCPEPADGE